jgi:hypothetical protein
VTAGNADLSGSPLFIVLDDGCAGQALTPSASCDLTVAFTASQTGPQTATLTVAPEGDGAPAQVTLTATGLGPTPIEPLPVPLEPPPIPGPSCHVPKLLGRSLDATRKTLRNHNCRLGAVAGRKQKGARIVRQHPRQGRTLPANAPVSVKVRS